ncbi:DNA/RNA non-specific endonuclease-like protein [Leishmania major strain Friedlin]|uniref:DNA/RNA non-specific endonuclease-like protein n=1 Tax=Leishmania major TaxID=5664 RepID=Q4QG27_LEIMA|nr:DNA/RNA non-specific endonuclease-like protein [Leishmania major strain Friedlin]CAG9571111.1 DNA/RNA_non-specific_endonuclease-like_protein [Leishmania major strain Friedlin]CAJ03068.1 DNA/RNA non-specific endonuclease-like protein [Leishmania major strain Friedlin]|eukprot:XP_001681871.1 DNA/RNA non-specific endonuclease-like protein [Leishmania major strain Friedlin]
MLPRRVALACVGLSSLSLCFLLLSMRGSLLPVLLSPRAVCFRVFGAMVVVVGGFNKHLRRSTRMESVPAKPAAVQPSTLGSSCDCVAPAVSLPSLFFLFPQCCAQAARRLLHDCTYFAAGPRRGARAQPTPTSSLSSPAPSQPLKLWLTCATAAVAGTCGAIVGARLSPWLSRRAARLYTQREAKYRNPLWLLPSPAAAPWPGSWWWRRLWRTSTHRSVSETRRLDYGHAAEWLAACTGCRWLPQRLSRPTLLKLYSPARHSRQSSADRNTAAEVQWGTRMVNKGTHPLAKRSAVAAASKGSTTSLAASALFSIVHFTRAPLHQWQPLPQHAVDVFVSATCQNTENRRSATLAAASPLLCLPRQGFALLYDPVARLPVWCGYYLTRETVDRARRQNRCITFFTDRSLKKTTRRVPAELKARGHDRGHLAPHASVAASPQAAIEAALLSNVLLQHRQINRGVWRWLEAATRAYVRHLPLADVPHAVAMQQHRVRRERSTGAVGAGAAPPSEAATSTQAGPTPAPPRHGAGCKRRRGRPPKSASPLFASPARCSSTCGQAAKRSSRGGSRRGLPRDSELIARLLAAPGVGSGTGSHLRLQGDGVWGCVARTLRCCREWWRWWWPHCSGAAFHRQREREVAVNVGPLYYKQTNDVGQGSWRGSGTATGRTPAIAAASSDAVALPLLCCSRSRQAIQRRGPGNAASPPTRPSPPPPPPPQQSLLIPDAFFFSLWNVHTHEHVHLIVPNHPDAASIRAFTAVVAPRRSTAAGAAASRWPSDDLETALRSLVVSTVELEQLFAESLVELRSRCVSAGVTDATSRDSMRNINRAASSVALRTHFSLFPVYRQRWMWRHCGSGGGSR